MYIIKHTDDFNTDFYFKGIFFGMAKEFTSKIEEAKKYDFKFDARNDIKSYNLKNSKVVEL